MSGRTPSDEAVERGARALYERNGGTEWDHKPFTQLRAREEYRAIARAVLVAAFPSGEQPGGEDESEICGRCGEGAAGSLGRDTYWFADSPLWNEVEPDKAVIRCPRCFTADAAAKGIAVGWRAGRVGDIEELVPSSEYRRAISDVVAALRDDVEAPRPLLWRQQVADFVERRFAPPSEGED